MCHLNVTSPSQPASRCHRMGDPADPDSTRFLGVRTHLSQEDKDAPETRPGTCTLTPECLSPAPCSIHSPHDEANRAMIFFSQRQGQDPSPLQRLPSPSSPSLAFCTFLSATRRPVSRSCPQLRPEQPGGWQGRVLPQSQVSGHPA